MNGIGSICMISSTELLVLEDLGGRFAIVDSSGSVTVISSIASQQCDERGDSYELYSSSTGPVIMDNRVFLETDWSGACNDRVEDWESESELAYVTRYFKEATPKCKIAELRVDSANGILRFGACGLLNALTDTVRSTFGSAHCAVLNGQLFSFSPYSPFLYRVEPKELEIAERFPISLNGKAVGILPPPVSAEDIAMDGDNIRFATKAYILSAAYDASSEKYLVSVCHKIPEDAPESERGTARAWSVIVLNDSFQQEQEVEYAGRELNGSVLLSLQTGVWVMQRSHGRQAARESKVFRRLVIQE